MKQKDIEILIQKYLNGETTPEEEKALALEVSRGDAPQEWRIIAEMLGELTIDEALYDKMMAERSKKPRIIKFWPWVAAACVAALLIVFLAPPREEARQMAEVEKTITPKKEVKDSVKTEPVSQTIQEDKQLAQVAEKISTTAKPKHKQMERIVEHAPTHNDLAEAKAEPNDADVHEDLPSVSDRRMEDFYERSTNIHRCGQQLVHRVSMNNNPTSSKTQYTNL